MRRILCILFSLWAFQAQAQDMRHLAPGFSLRLVASKLLVVPVDMELFSISAGGVQEPRADWTQQAADNFKSSLQASVAQLGPMVTMQEVALDEWADINALHGAVAEAIFIHHVLGIAKLPTKNDTLNWSLGEAIEPLRAKTGADYALFTWVRDTYASSERKAAMAVMALFGVGLTGGAQIGYASLVDLHDGRIVWFNDLRRASGDLREKDSAMETVRTLLKGLPLMAQRQ